jgi:hypothetical protein
MKNKLFTLVAVLLTIALSLGMVQFAGSQTAANAVVQTLELAASGSPGSNIFLSTSGNEMVLEAIIEGRASAVVLCLTRCNPQAIYNAWVAAGASLTGWLQIAPSQIPSAFKAVMGINTFSVLMNTVRARGMSLAMRMASTPFLVFVLPVSMLEQPDFSQQAQ